VNYSEWLDRIARYRLEIGEAALRGPASEAAIERTRAILKRDFGADLPQAYADFLRQCDGLNENGEWLHCAAPEEGCEDVWAKRFQIPEQTLNWRDQPNREDQIILGMGGDVLYVVDLKGGNPRSVETILDEVYETFNSVEEMIVHVLRRSLNLN
jgi:hypothetical protein